MYLDAWLQSKVIRQNKESWNGAATDCFERSRKVTKSSDPEASTRLDKSDRSKAKKNQPVENLALLKQTGLPVYCRRIEQKAGWKLCFEQKTHWDSDRGWYSSYLSAYTAARIPLKTARAMSQNFSRLFREQYSKEHKKLWTSLASWNCQTACKFTNHLESGSSKATKDGQYPEGRVTAESIVVNCDPIGLIGLEARLLQVRGD